MTKFSKYIGLDVHKETIAVGIADGRGGRPRSSTTNTSQAVTNPWISV